MERLENRKGQNTIEYLLVFGVVLMVIAVVLSPKEGGFFRSHLDNALDLSMEGVECMAAAVCYNSEGCPAVCGDGCCQEGEDCPQDCSSACIRDPNLAPCDISGCMTNPNPGCEIVTVEENPGGCHWEHGKINCSPKIPGYSTCQELPCAGDNQSECEDGKNYCVWR